MLQHLVVVESPTKAKTIKRFLGKEYLVEASMGHVRDLPTSSLGVDTDQDFTPKYVIPAEKRSVVKHLKEVCKRSNDIWIATDEDREGEAIGWHVVQVLGVEDPTKVKRIAFHEITESAVREAVAHPRSMNMCLVEAQQSRRVLDRLVGYTLSPLLWKKVRSGLSAGRVQSVAVRIIVDREREVRAFVPMEYWTIDALLSTSRGEDFCASLKERDGEKFIPKEQGEADAVLAELRGDSFTVAALEEKEVHKTPPPPFTTSTLQQEAARKLGFSVKQTMVVAQQLYEGVDIGSGQGSQGLITYMRTDSLNLSEKALTDAPRVITQQYGREYVLANPRRFKTKTKGAQEAHEAIRPTELDRTPASLQTVLDHQQLKLYTLIWNRTLATQMAVATLKRIAVSVRSGRYLFRATGQTVLFDGYLRVYTEGRDEEEGGQNGRRKEGQEGEDGTSEKIPVLKEGEGLLCRELKPEQHFTKPPPRYTEASLVKKLEEEGIGRPSTYAPTISTIQQRGYIRKEGKNLLPEDIAFTVIDLLLQHFREIVDLTFTATMESSLDAIANGKQNSVRFLRSFYDPFIELVGRKTQELKKEEITKERVLGVDPETGQEIYLLMGRFGPYVQVGKEKAKGKRGKTASLPKGTDLESLTLEGARALLAFPRDLGVSCGRMLTVCKGRYGPYLKWGEENISLPKDRDVLCLTLEEAQKCIEQQKEQLKKAAESVRKLGKDPTTGGEIQVKDGRYGPYVTDGRTNASLGKKLDPAEITFEKAAEMLAKKRVRGKRQWRGR